MLSNPGRMRGNGGDAPLSGGGMQLLSPSAPRTGIHQPDLRSILARTGPAKRANSQSLTGLKRREDRRPSTRLPRTWLMDFFFFPHHAEGRQYPAIGAAMGWSDRTGCIGSPRQGSCICQAGEKRFSRHERNGSGQPRRNLRTASSETRSAADLRRIAASHRGE